MNVAAGMALAFLTQRRAGRPRRDHRGQRAARPAEGRHLRRLRLHRHPRGAAGRLHPVGVLLRGAVLRGPDHRHPEHAQRPGPADRTLAGAAGGRDPGRAGRRRAGPPPVAGLMSGLDPLLITSFLVGAAGGGGAACGADPARRPGRDRHRAGRGPQSRARGHHAGGSARRLHGHGLGRARAPAAPRLAPWLGLGAGMLAGLAMGLVMAVLSCHAAHRPGRGRHHARGARVRASPPTSTARPSAASPRVSRRWRRVACPGLAELPVLGPGAVRAGPGDLSQPALILPASGSSSSAPRWGLVARARWASIRRPPIRPASTSSRTRYSRRAAGRRSGRPRRRGADRGASSASSRKASRPAGAGSPWPS